MGSEIAFESLSLAIETTKGTAVTPPERVLGLRGMLTPQQALAQPQDAYGQTVRHHRSVKTRNWSTWTASGSADTLDLGELLKMCVKNSVAASNPESGVDLFEYVPAVSGSAALSQFATATMYFNGLTSGADKSLRGAFGFLQSLSFTNDATGTNVAQISASGLANNQTTQTDVVQPDLAGGKMFAPMYLQAWLDTSSDIGSTALSAKVIRVQHTLNTGLVPKFVPSGTSSTLDYSSLGLQERVGLQTQIMLRLTDLAEYDIFQSDTDVKLRVRHNGPLIAGSSYNYIDFDSYGPLESLQWGEFEGANRVVSFTINSHYDATLGADFRVALQRAS